MQVKVRDVRADKARRGNADLGVHVRAIEVNLAAKLMHHFAHFANGLFVNAVGGRIGHHDAGEVRRMLLGFRPQVSKIDIAVFIAGHHHHLHSRHLRGSRVGAVSGAWDQADIAMPLVAAFVVMTNRQQARVFALRAGVRLHADRIVAGQLNQPVGELSDHLVIGKFRPGDGDHLGGGIQLHGAGAQRDHRLVQRQILTLQRVHIAHHLGFAVVAVKHRMSKDRIVAQHAGRDRAAIEGHVFIQGVDIQAMIVAKDGAEQVQDVFTRGGFVKGDPDGMMNIAAQVNAQRFRPRQHSGFIGNLNAQGIEVVRMAELKAFFLQTIGQNIGQTVNTAGDTLQASRTVEYRVQAGNVGQQHLRSTDIGVRFLAANMLLARLHRHAQRGIARRIFRYADNTARHGAFEFIFGGKESRVRAAVAHRYAKALGGAKNDVRALLTRCGQQNQRHKIGGDADNHFARFQVSNQFAVIMNLAGGAHLLQQYAEDVLMVERFFRIIDNHIETEGLRAGAHYVQGLRVNVGGDEETVGVFQFAYAFGHRHRFRGGGSFVQQRG